MSQTRPPDDALADQVADQLRLQRRQLASGETVRLKVRSGSMVPLMPVGAHIEVAPATGADCRVGDVVVFRRGSQLVAHRLLLGWGGAPAGAFLERGDGVSAAGWLRPAEILGRVVAVEHPSGRRLDLAGDQARWQARRAVRSSLWRLLRETVRSRLGRRGGGAQR